MRRPDLVANLERLCRSLEDEARASGAVVPDPPSDAATRLSAGLFLANSASDETFSTVCESGWLHSAARLSSLGLRPLVADSPEAIMGTTGSVFFYVAPFRYLDTGCGLLFAATLESKHRDDGIASPFDSGGLVRHFSGPDPAEPPRTFLARHELPLPEHRKYLCLCMDVLFGSPWDYVEGRKPTRQGSVRLLGGDQRSWTHEVRIPDSVWIRSGHLQAVFAPIARVAGDPHIEALFDWCLREGVDRVPYGASRENDFEGLKRECLAYIQEQLG